MGARRPVDFFPPMDKLGAAPAMDGDADGDGKDWSSKGWTSPASCVRAVLRRGSPFLRRRCADLLVLCFFYPAVLAVGHYVVTTELLQPQDAATVHILRRVYLVVFALFNLSLLGVSYHGPGRPPLPVPGPALGQDAALPSPVAGALAAGKLCRRRPFSAEDGFCGKCESQKPALAHHCHTCDACSWWMDHHCNFAAQCVGFRNMRCFLVWLAYGHLLMALLAALTLRRLVEVGLPSSAWAWAGWISWFVYIHRMSFMLNFHLSTTYTRIMLGWPSKVMLEKFTALFRDAKALERDVAAILAALPEGGAAERAGIQSAVDGLRAASARLEFRKGPFRGMLWGPFKDARPLGTISAVFGSPPSWRWLLPLVAGGEGAPTVPAIHSVPACEAWSCLAAAMQHGQSAIAEHHQAAVSWARHAQAPAEEAAMCQP